jgi:chromosome partitioning protein
MHVIVINSQKGGSGKTCLTRHLAVTAVQAGSTPLIIDTDPQGTLTGWHQKRKADDPPIADVTLENLPRALDKLRLRGRYSHIIIDTASGRLDIAARLFDIADLVLFPVQPSQDDLSAVPRTVQLLRKRPTPFLFVLNRIKPNTRLTAQTAIILSKHGQICPTVINDRVGYKSEFANGATCIEGNADSAAAAEINALWRDVTVSLIDSKHAVEHARMPAITPAIAQAS